MLAQFKNKNLYLMLGADLVLLVLAMLLAYLLRFDFAPDPRYWSQIPYVLALGLPIKLAALYIFGLYQGMWRYTDLLDFWKLFQAILTSSLILVAIILFRHRFQGFPRSVFFMDGVLAFCLCGALRVLVRTFYRSRENLHITFFLPWNQLKKKKKNQTNVLIIGAGDAGEKILREILENPELNYEIMGFLDDDPSKLGRSVHGIPILGTTTDIQAQARRFGVAMIFIAIPSASGQQMKNIVDCCERAKVQFKTLPGIGELIDGRVSVSQFREVNFQDLLGRKQVDLSFEAISSYLTDKVVLITGAGGSIGSELVRQIARFRPQRLLLVEQSESVLYAIEMELTHELQFEGCVPILGQVQDRPLVERVFAQHRPQVVFHAAAYKHVPMLELNPWEAVFNNVAGSQVVMETAHKWKTNRFVLVSTDKAVRPTNVMGASKRVTELIMQSMPQGETKYMAVRFGNVLGSAGSVIPLFQRQIRRGGPLTVTHPEVTRYFMTIAEACQLIVQAGGMGRGGEIFVLKMGKPIKIVDMARDLIRLSGKEPEVDIGIQFTGLRPGEKLYEELITGDEGVVETEHADIMVLRPETDPRSPGRSNQTQLSERVQDLIRVAGRMECEGVKAALQQVVPEYAPTDGKAVLHTVPVFDIMRDEPLSSIER